MHNTQVGVPQDSRRLLKGAASLLGATHRFSYSRAEINPAVARIVTPAAARHKRGGSNMISGLRFYFAKNDTEWMDLF